MMRVNSELKLKTNIELLWQFTIHDWRPTTKMNQEPE